MSPLLRADFDVVPLDTPDTACFAAVVMRAPEAASDKLADVLKVLTASSSSTSSSSSPNMPASWKTPSRAPPLAGTIMEWICMQHPPLPAPAPEINEGDVDSSGGGGRNRSYSTGGGGSVFPTSRPPYPGQRHPGLHILKPISHLFVRMAATHGRDGLVSTPEHLHNAVLYMAGGWVPFNPAFLGYLRALCLHDLRADLVKHGIAAVSWAMRNGHVVGVQTRVVETWSPQEIVYPTSGRVLAYVRGEGFMRVAAEVERTMKGRVKIEWESAKEIWGYSLDPETRARASGA
ncbi:hypothetical protein DFJ73DRAFT_838144 [Zopfochytrium polystomum]|nr:hypothetical protein DFJ73DRAFT_838144 [Zopfochytrium polystomum]